MLGDDGVFYVFQDEWWKLINELGFWMLVLYGEEGDRLVVILNMLDMDIDLFSFFDVVYVLLGTFVFDLILFDINVFIVLYSIRLTVIVERVEGLYIIVVGIEGLGVEFGDFVVFFLFIKNIGNGLI